MVRNGTLAALLVLACAPSPREQAPAAPVPPEATAPRPAEPAPPPEQPVERMAPPEVAYAHGWMPLASTASTAICLVFIIVYAPVLDQGWIRPRSRGNGIVSRKWSIPQIHVKVRSRPRPNPLCGTDP